MLINPYRDWVRGSWRAAAGSFALTLLPSSVGWSAVP
jgi:hypothetical protein